MARLARRWVVCASIGALAALLAPGAATGKGRWLSEVTFGHGGLWTLNEDGVLRLDPDDGCMLAGPTPVRGEGLVRLAVGDDEVWALAHDGRDRGRAWLTRLDPDTARALGPARPVDGFPLALAPSSRGGTWVLAYEARRLLLLDRDAARTLVAIDGLPELPEAVLADDRSVWVASTGPWHPGRGGVVVPEGAGSLTRFDARFGFHQATIRVGVRPLAVATGGGYVWVFGASALSRTPRTWAVRIDPHTNRVVTTLRFGGFLSYAAGDGRTLWLQDPIARVTVAIDGASGTRRGGLAPAGAALRAFGGGRLWSVEAGDSLALVGRDPRRLHRVTDPIAVPIQGAGRACRAGSGPMTTSRQVINGLDNPFATPVLAPPALVARPSVTVPDRRLATCRSLPHTGPAGLPAAVTLRTRSRTECGSLRLSPDGRVTRTPWRSTDPPVPQGGVVSLERDPSLWVVQRDGRIALVRNGNELWRSAGRYRLLRNPCQLTGVAASERYVAFAFRDFRPNPACERFFVARIPGPERVVAGMEGEQAFAWIGRDRLVTTRYLGRRAGFRVTLRDRFARRLRVLATGAVWQHFDREHAEVVYATNDKILRIGSGGPQVLGDRAALGLADRRGLYLSTLPGRRIALSTTRALVVLESDGRPFASTRLQPSFESLALSPDQGAFAYVSVRFSQRTGARRAALMLLAKGARRARQLVAFRAVPATPTWASSIPWRGTWLLASTSDGQAAAIDTRSARRVELQSLARELGPPGPGTGGLIAEWG